MSATMMSALKITAEAIADSELSSCMMSSSSSTGNVPANIAGMIAKYLATSFAIENVVSDPRVISSCFPISTISMSLVGFESRSTMFPASRAACVPVFIATPTSAAASAGRVVRAVTRHGHEIPAGLLPPDQGHLVLGLRLGEEVVDAGFLGNRLGGERVVAGDHHGADAHPPKLGEALAHPFLDDVLQVDDAQRRRVGGDDERRPAGDGDPLDDGIQLRRHRATAVLDPPPDGVGCTLANRVAVEVDSAHPRLSGERDERSFADCPLTQSVPLLREHHDRAPFWRLVRETRELSCVRELALVHAGERQELRRLPVAEGDRARLVEQERRAIARRLDRTPRQREHVAPNEPVHAGDPDRR